MDVADSIGQVALDRQHLVGVELGLVVGIIGSCDKVGDHINQGCWLPIATLFQFTNGAAKLVAHLLNVTSLEIDRLDLLQLFFQLAIISMGFGLKIGHHSHEDHCKRMIALIKRLVASNANLLFQTIRHEVVQSPDCQLVVCMIKRVIVRDLSQSSSFGCIQLEAGKVGAEW